MTERANDSVRVGNVNVSRVLVAAGRQAIPCRAAVRHLKRMMRPYEDDENSEYCITNGLSQIAALRNAGIDVRGKELLEFGTGWVPLIPWLFHLAGAGKLILTDIEHLMDQQTIERARRTVKRRIKDIAETLQEPESSLIPKIEGQMTFEYLVPWDAAAQPDESVDLVISRAVFEHVPVAQLQFFLQQFHRILREGGAMAHVVDNSDHWEHRDHHLSRINFLRFDEHDMFWRLAQFNPQSFQNRLRHDDYVSLIERAGFHVDAALGEPDQQCLKDARSIAINARFAGKTTANLAILTSLFVARKTNLPAD
ncbi:MAG: methyltransferase domain-containing protein [Acetobacteraceae bacterium]